MRKAFSIIILLFIICSQAFTQSLELNTENRLKDYFSNDSTIQNLGKYKLSKYEIDNEKRTLVIYPSTSFGYQSFTPQKVNYIYSSIKKVLPGPVNYYDIKVIADGKPIEELIPNYLLKHNDKSRMLGKLEYKDNPWVKNISDEAYPSKGLNGKHIMIWQSHGNYYNSQKGLWEWQRPNLFTTNEDIFTLSFVTEYVMPMMQNAGAVVITPRERDWQKNEVIVDNDGNGTYYEKSSRKSKWMTHPQKGFAQKYKKYLDNHNPFNDGTVRFTTTERKAEKAFAQWIPNIPETGKYAVYVTYQSLPESIEDAHYLVFHKGGVTEFQVNQQMGGGTWVYLGTFEFDKGNNDYGMVALSNQSKRNGVVCADAVRFGGGMGNIMREGKISGLPRYLEGARYSAQWYGMPYEVYSKSNGTNDYNDDINTRGNMVNYLSGGSIYNPESNGLKVPIDLSMGMHSDAGYTTDNSLIGSLGIYTTDTDNGMLGSGISRYASRNLADMVLTGLKNDISVQFNINWPVRGMWNRNYSETRIPSVPSMILEILSHQNFADMKLGHDPRFKFTVGRSIYKSVLKYLAALHNKDYVVEPLPVKDFLITEGKKKNTFVLSWKPTKDMTEPTAKAQEYKVYTRIGKGGFDNGTLVSENNYTFKAEPGIVYSFKITAVNKGGESFPSEILSACKAKRSKGTILIVNGFNRLSGPASINSTDLQGFDIDEDGGMPYISTTSICGKQLNFNKESRDNKQSVELGFSGQEMEGKVMAGNSFDYPFIHGKAIQRTGRYSFISSSMEAFEQGELNLDNYFAIDYIYGAQKEPLTSSVRNMLTLYSQRGGNIMISGTSIASAADSRTISFMKDVLKCDNGGSMHTINTGCISGLGLKINIPTKLNEKIYCAEATDCIAPLDNAFSTFIYTPGNYSAGTAYKGKHRTFVMGFPFECINGEMEQAAIMNSVLTFFETK